jgi:hypothetical protein
VGFAIYSAHSASASIRRVEMAGKKLAGLFLGARSQRAPWPGRARPVKPAQFLSMGVYLGLTVSG